MKSIKELVSEFSSALPKLKVGVSGSHVTVSVPNDTKSCRISYINGLYVVEDGTYSTTYINLDEAVLEVITCLVTRELFSNGFTEDEVNYVIKNLRNGETN